MSPRATRKMNTVTSVSGSPHTTSMTWSPQDLPAELRTALDAALDKKALAPAVLRVTELAGYTDWVLILSARSERQVAAVAEAISIALKRHGRRARGTDGFDGHQWDLLDYDDFIIHVFLHPVRTHFDLESMWSDAPRVELHLPPEVMDTSGIEDVFAPPPAPARPEYHGDVRFGGFEDEFEAADDEWDDGDDGDDGDAHSEDEDDEDDEDGAVDEDVKPA
jgi:ribosome silencing factor RsfS/YbeB/iojap